MFHFTFGIENNPTSLWKWTKKYQKISKNIKKYQKISNNIKPRKNFKNYFIYQNLLEARDFQFTNGMNDMNDF
jgi:hypothetical protein